MNMRNIIAQTHKTDTDTGILIKFKKKGGKERKKKNKNQNNLESYESITWKENIKIQHSKPSTVVSLALRVRFKIDLN